MNLDSGHAVDLKTLGCTEAASNSKSGTLQSTGFGIRAETQFAHSVFDALCV